MSNKMTLTLEFERDVPDDRRDLLLTVNARAIAAVICSLDEHLRRRAKYAGSLSEETVSELHAVRDKLREDLGDLAEAVFG